MNLIPIHFFGEPIEAHFIHPPTYEKRPGPPDSFTWRGQHLTVREVLNEWHDYRRRGRMARNMQPQHSEAASRHGSWGVGQDYYRVRTSDGHIYDIYYDRAPQDVNRRKGGWFIDKELAEDEGQLSSPTV